MKQIAPLPSHRLLTQSEPSAQVASAVGAVQGEPSVQTPSVQSTMVRACVPSPQTQRPPSSQDALGYWISPALPLAGGRRGGGCVLGREELRVNVAVVRLGAQRDGESHED